MGWFRPGTSSCIAPCLLQLYYHHQVVQSLQELWYQYAPLLSSSDKQPQNVESAAQLKSSTLSLQLRRQDSSIFKTVESSFGFVKSKTSSKTSLKISPWKKIVEMVMEENELELKNIKSTKELALANVPKWNFCLKDFREVQENSQGMLGTCGRASERPSKDTLRIHLRFCRFLLRFCKPYKGLSWDSGLPKHAPQISAKIASPPDYLCPTYHPHWGHGILWYPESLFWYPARC